MPQRFADINFVSTPPRFGTSCLAMWVSYIDIYIRIFTHQFLNAFFRDCHIDVCKGCETIRGNTEQTTCYNVSLSSVRPSDTNDIVNQLFDDRQQRTSLETCERCQLPTVHIKKEIERRLPDILLVKIDVRYVIQFLIYLFIYLHTKFNKLVKLMN